MIEKSFAVSFAVSCKNMRCTPSDSKCHECICSMIDTHFIKSFNCAILTTPNGSRKFDVSFVAICRKPDPSKELPRIVAVCTATEDKCDMCMRSIVMQGIHLHEGFHVKEIEIV